jgi:hypothetical protein
MAKCLVQESNKNAFDQYSEECDKKLTPKTFKEEEKVLLK